MKVCVTAAAGDLNAQVDPRFGRCQYFVLVDSDTMAFEAMANEATAAPGGAGIQAAQTVVNKGVAVLISGNIGPNAFQVLSTAGVKIVTGAYGTVKEAIELYKNGKLSEAGASTVSAHAGMGSGFGMGGGRGGGGRGMGSNMMQQQPGQKSLKGDSEMKIGIPTMGDRGLEETISEHFGRAPTFTIVDMRTNEVSVLPNTGEHFGGVKVAPEILSEEGVEVMLCSGLGPRAISMFEQFGIEVYVGAESGGTTVRDALNAFQAGLLHEVSDKDACALHRHEGIERAGQ